MAKTDWQKANYRVENQSEQHFTITVSGRDRWALECLIRAGQQGCTPGQSIEYVGDSWGIF